MSGFGPCSEPFCNEISARLFDCAHHCKKLVCLQHLIEHDQMTEYTDDYVHNLRTELQQLWTSYSSLTDETKLHFEYEQKLKRHQQLIRDISSLFEINSMNIEHYRLMIEKLQQNIEQEEQRDQNSIESFPQIEQVKSEPIDVVSTTDELDSFDISLSARLEKLNSNTTQERDSMIDDYSTVNESNDQINDTYDNSDTENINTQTFHISRTRKLSSICPFWQNGAYGLGEDSHGMYLCPHRKYKDMYDHLKEFHRLKTSSIKRIFQAIQTKKDPSKEILFQIDDIVIDETNNQLCPFSIYNNESIKTSDSITHSCRRLKPLTKHRLLQHFNRDHRIPLKTGKKLVYKIKNN